MLETTTKIKKIAGISEMIVSDNPGEILITYSLGSCLGVTIYDPVVKIGGIIHCMLPLSSVDKKKAEKAPAMFVDCGFPLLLETMFKMGVQKKNIILKAAGCAQMLDPQGRFKIGERNFAMLRKILWKNGILINGQQIGGCVSRTVALDMETGITTIRSQGKEVEI